MFREIRYWVDYFLPREVMGPVIIVFSLENIIDRVFSMYMPISSEFFGWVAVFVISVAIVGFWGVEDDEDMEELEETMEERL